MPAAAGQGGRNADLTAGFQSLVGEVFRLNGRLLDVAGELSRGLHVTPTHWQIIATVRNGPLTIPAISRRVGLRRQSVQHNIGQLLARKLVEQVDNPDHRRSSLVRLSADGRALMQVLLVRQVELTRRFTAGTGLRAADLETMVAQLQRMRARSEGKVEAGGGGRVSRAGARR